MSDTIKVGIVGTGKIAPAYIKGGKAFNILEIVACTDLDMDRAVAFAQENDLKAMTADDMMADSDIDIILDLTIPQAHAEVALKAIAAGKHVYNEKPLALDRDEGAKMLQAAKEAGVLIGCAPDTFLGGGIQTCRKIIDDGVIGEPVAATAFLAGHGHESWHPSPEFYYKAGGGPLFDMGPYYLTALVNLMGPIQRVAGSARTTFPTRTITSQPLYGTVIDVDVATHISAVMDFAAGGAGTIITSFDVWAHTLPRIEIYGSLGSLSVPDPNRFDGPVRVWTKAEGEWRDVALTHTTEIGRGAGVADMAYALKSGRAHRASGELSYHVLEVMQSIIESSDQNQHITIESRPERPAALPVGLLPGQLDD